MSWVRWGHSGSGYSAARNYQNQSVPNQSGIALVAVLVFLLVIAAVVALKGGEELGEIHVAAADAEVRRIDYVAQAGLQHALWRARGSACSGDFTLAANTLGPDSYVATTSGGATSTAHVLSADQDAWIRSDNPGNTGGGDQHIRFEGGNIEQALYRFDLSALPAGAQINAATAWFYLEGGKEHPEGPLTVHRITADWTEAGATWDTLNGNFEAFDLAMIPAQATGGVWVQINLTGQVQAWVNGQPNYGIMLGTVAEGIHSEYKSREDASTPPRLEVVVGTGAPSPLNIQATGTLANGKTRVLTRPAARALQPPAGVTLQPGPADGVDAYIWEARKTDNYGTDDETWVSQSTNNTSLSLLKFNMGALPAGAKILEATLSLHHRSGNDPSVPVTAHRIVNAWNEDFVTWNQRDNGTNWDTAGGDIDSTVIATTSVGVPTFRRHEWNITSLAQGWTEGLYPNYGVALATAMNGAVGERFDTSDFSDSTRRPSLAVTYACECGSACMAPQGKGNITMAVINPTTLVSSDAYKKALFEFWGYTVDVIGESANQAAYDAAAVTSDVFFISETVNSNQLGNKLVNVPIGVVSQDGSYNSDLGLAGGSAWPVSPAINVADPSHYITAVFPAGSLEIYSAAMEQLTVSGGAATGLQTLADTGGAGSLVALDTGAALLGGGSAAGRRVMLPLGREGRMNWDYLNNNGQLVVQRAIAWAMGADAPSVANVLLVVVDPGNLTAQEVAKQALMESWDYTVNLIDESDNQGEFDTAVAANDVVFITEDVSSGNVGNKLVNATIGVVNEEGGLVDEFGFAPSEVNYSATDIGIVDVSHYITIPFVAGPLTITSSPQDLQRLTGVVATGLDSLAESSGLPTLAAIEVGGGLAGGGNAAGRRAQLPWGANAFDFNALNADGLTIFQRALEWGAGATTVTTPIAHWKLDEGSGPTAVDSVGGNDATLNGGTTWTTGTLAGALDFDGSGDYATTDNNFTPPPVGTVTFWMQVPGSPGSHGRILGLDDTWEIRHVTTGTPDGIPYGLVFDLGVSGVNTEFVTTTTIDVPGRWYHVAAAYDTTTDAYAVYIDGVPHKSGTYPTALAVPAANPLSLGTRTGSSNYFDGVLDDVRIYDRFLSAAEIADLAAAGGSAGPVAHWKLDDGAGTTAIDSEGSNDGTLVNGPTWVAGQLGDALHFDGSNDYVDAGTFDVSGSGLTLIGWFNADTIPTSDPRIISKANGTNESDTWWQLSAADSGSNRYLRLRAKAGGTTTTFADSSVNLLPGQWYLAAGTYTAATGDMKLYLDGVEIASGSHAVGGPVDTDPAVPVWIGANGTAARFFEGVLDDVRVYDKALSAGEIGDLFAAGGGGGGPTSTFEGRVATSSDDAEERVSNGNVNLTSSDLELISDGSNAQLVGMRFTNVTVPNGATIANAYVQFQVDETNSGGTNVDVQGQAIDDAPTFTNSNSNISSRSLTTATVPWAPVSWTTVGDAGPDQQTSDIASVIQEIVNRPGWVSGNDIVIVLTGSGERTAESYNGVSAAAPLLHIEY